MIDEKAKTTMKLTVATRWLLRRCHAISGESMQTIAERACRREWLRLTEEAYKQENPDVTAPLRAPNHTLTEVD